MPGTPRVLAIIAFFAFVLLIILTAVQKERTASIAPTVPSKEIIQVAAVGDFLMHLPVVKAAYNQKTGSYSFKEMFREVEPFLSSPDLTIGNLETRLADKGKGYSGYPLFNTPAELAVDLKALGVDVIATANNHSLDKGTDGIIKTLDNLQKTGLVPLGTYRNPAEREKPVTCRVKGINIGFLNYTQHVNGNLLPQDKKYMVDLIDEEAIKNNIQALKQEGVDLIIAYMHFGAEYQRQPDAYQKKITGLLFQEGVDIVLGDHVHVLQPMEKQKVKFPAENTEKEVFVAYSLGNFISNQRWRYSDSGVILNLSIEKDYANGKTTLQKVDYTPVWVHIYQQNGQKKYRVVAVEKAIYDFEKKEDPLLTADDYRRLKEVWSETTGLLDKPEQDILASRFYQQNLQENTTSK